MKMDLLHRSFPGRRSFLTALGSLALLAGIVPAAAAAAHQPAAPKAPASSAGSNCSVGYLQSKLHLAHVTVDSAVFDTSGSFTPPGTTTPLTGLPDFCAVSLTQTDQAGNPISIAVWLPANWNGRFQGIGCKEPSSPATRAPPPTAGYRPPTGSPESGR
jgi:feruloyl esterase